MDRLNWKLSHDCGVQLILRILLLFSSFKWVLRLFGPWLVGLPLGKWDLALSAAFLLSAFPSFSSGHHSNKCHPGYKTRHDNQNRFYICCTLFHITGATFTIQDNKMAVSQEKISVHSLAGICTPRKAVVVAVLIPTRSQKHIGRCTPRISQFHWLQAISYPI